MPTANEALRDRILSHQIGLQRLSTREVRLALRALEGVAREVRARLRQRLEVAALLGFDRGPLSTARLRSILNEVDEILDAGYRQIRDQLKLPLGDLALSEPEAVRRATRASIPREIALDSTLPPPNVLRKIVTARPFQGKLLREHFAKLPQVMRRRIGLVLREGLIAGDSVETMIRRLPWSKARNELKAVVDSAVKHVSQSSRGEFLESNAGPDGVVKAELWDSTLDLRTTKHICVPRDGKRYTVRTHRPIGHSYPWIGGPGRAHFR